MGNLRLLTATSPHSKILNFSYFVPVFLLARANASFRAVDIFVWSCGEIPADTMKDHNAWRKRHVAVCISSKSFSLLGSVNSIFNWDTAWVTSICLFAVNRKRHKRDGFKKHHGIHCFTAK